ncbi:SAM-dependent methyltransferase [Antrihabitans cavernicola]|uniref:S-adenosyl-L-methionine-dependent methyltransferase n=1 Tax=Antrihabitans cavernicola TaxID=2495913 RepID=A0A5A7SA16_9NOCA|nr:SAM-dependent methyltransferase [Spelaeibacter cavernicola]KAA0021413.1 SAM-dependent methyltransferase [Spelaeibacter cavernicola]
MTEESLDGVARTALGVAMARARESERPDRMFDDPLAAVFVSASGDSVGRNIDALAPEARQAVVAMYHWVTARTRFLDGVCAAAVDDGLDQVVIVGAGLDTRGFRLGWPADLDLFEIDRTDIFTFKEKALDDASARPTCRRHVVVADLMNDWDTTLADAGFDNARRTLWLAEGLFVYFPADDVRRLLTTITELSPPGSRFGVTTRSVDASTATPISNDPHAAVRALWHHTEFEIVDWLSENGWEPTVTDPRDVLVEAGRIAPSVVNPVGRPRLVSALRS